MQYWRVAGLKFVLFLSNEILARFRPIHSSYIQYSAVCARTLRRCLKTSMAKDAMKREESYIRVNKWQGGKVSDLVHPASEFTFHGAPHAFRSLSLESEQAS